MTVFEKLSKYKIAKNTSVLTAAQMGSRFLTIFYVAALARYVGTEGIGAVSAAGSLNALLVLLVGPGLSVLFVRNVAPQLEHTGQYVSNMLFLRAVLTIPFILLTSLIAYSGRYPAEMIGIIHLYTLVYIFDMFIEILLCVFRVYERMEYEAGLQIARDAINISLSLVGIFLGWSLTAIVAVSVFAQLCKLVMALVLVRHRFTAFKFSIDLSVSRSLLLASLPFGILLVIHTLQAELGTFVLSLYHDPGIVGVYAAANSLIIMLLMLPNAFASAVFPNLSRLQHQSKSELQRFYRLCYKYLLIVGFPLGLGTMLVGGRVVQLIYGDEFTSANSVIPILAIFLFTIVGYSNGPVLNVTGQQRYYAWTQSAAAVLNTVLCFLLVPAYGAEGAAASVAVSGLVTFVVHSGKCFRLLDLTVPWGMIAKVSVATLMMGGVVVIGLQTSIPWLLIAAIIAPAVYLAALVLLKLIKLDELRILGGAPASPVPVSMSSQSG